MQLIDRVPDNRDNMINKNRVCTFNGEKAKVTTAFEPKLARTARLTPFPRVQRGKISDTISQLIGSKDIWNVCI